MTGRLVAKDPAAESCMTDPLLLRAAACLAGERAGA